MKVERERRWEKPWEKKGPKMVLKCGVFELVGIEHIVGVRGMFGTSTYMIVTKAPYHVQIIYDYLLHTMY
jgi:hypothetical protein